MTSGVVIMLIVATLIGGAGLAFMLSPSKSEAGVYRRRIAGTMGVAFAVVLYGYAWALHSWSVAR